VTVTALAAPTNAIRPACTNTAPWRIGADEIGSTQSAV